MTTQDGPSSGAREFAAELAHSYAPSLHIVAAAAGGVPVDLLNNLTYINGEPELGLDDSAEYRRDRPGGRPEPAAGAVTLRPAANWPGEARRVGNADGTGDGVMISRDVQQLAYEYCRRGVSVQFHEYTGDTHTIAAVALEPQATAFLEQRLNGQPAVNGGSLIWQDHHVG